MYILSSKTMKLHKENCCCVNMTNNEHKRFYDGVEHAQKECDGCISFCQRCFSEDERKYFYDKNKKSN